MSLASLQTGSLAVKSFLHCYTSNITKRIGPPSKGPVPRWIFLAAISMGQYPCSLRAGFSHSWTFLCNGKRDGRTVTISLLYAFCYARGYRIYQKRTTSILRSGPAVSFSATRAIKSTSEIKGSNKNKRHTEDIKSALQRTCSYFRLYMMQDCGLLGDSSIARSSRAL